MNKNELRAVVEKAQNGEKTAFEKLYKEFHEKLYFFVLKNVGDKHTAEDITEDSFLASMEGIGSLKEPEHYETLSLSTSAECISDKRAERIT